MKEIPGYEGVYSITREGMVWSHKRGGTGKSGRPAKGQWLKPCFHRGGEYLCVALRTPGELGSKQHVIHRLVLIVFVGPPPTPFHQANHLDGNKTNNNVDNLEWTTSSGNRKHAWSMGLIKQTQGRIEAGFKRGKKLRKLTWKQAVDIRESHSNGETQTNLAKKHGVDRKAISMILNRITYQREG